MLGIAAKTGSAEPQLITVADPLPLRGDQLLCRTLQIGVCGTDREILESRKPWTPPREDHLVLGHECLAEVIETGPSVVELQVGDLVVPVVRRANDPDVARPDLLDHGQYTERGIAFAHGFSTPVWSDSERYLFKIPKSMTEVAILTEPVSISEKGINEAVAIQQGRLGQRCWIDDPPHVLVTGQGPIAFGAVIAAVARNWPVTMVGRDAPDTFRSSLARELGANYQELATLGEAPKDLPNEGGDLILECTGSEHVMLKIANWMKSCAIMVWLGSRREPSASQLDLAQLMRNGLLRNHAFLGTVNAADRDFCDALEHLAQLHARDDRLLPRILTDYVSRDDSLWHYQQRRPQGIKTVIDFAR